MRNAIPIGQLAARFGLNPKTIRYYEAIGLLPPAERSDAGYRQYGEQDVARVGFVRRAKVLGLSLDEIRDLLSLASSGKQPCRRVLDLVGTKIDNVDRQIQRLQEFRRELVNLRSIWTDADGNPRPTLSPRVCSIIEEQTEVTEHPELAKILEPITRRHSG